MAGSESELTGRRVWTTKYPDGPRASGSVVRTGWKSGMPGREVVVMLHGGVITSVEESQRGTLWDFEQGLPQRQTQMR